MIMKECKRAPEHVEVVVVEEGRDILQEPDFAILSKMKEREGDPLWGSCGS